MTNQTKVDGDTLTIFVDEALDLEGIKEFEKSSEAITGNIRKVNFDFKQMEFIDSTGIGAIVKFIKSFEQLEFKGCHVNEDVREIFEIVGLDEFFSF